MNPPTLASLAADVEWPDAYAASIARARVVEGSGRLGDVLEWMAGTQGTHRPVVPARPRAIVVVGEPTEIAPGVAEVAERNDMGAQVAVAPTDVRACIAAGGALADAEVDAGTDLLVLAGPDTRGVAAAVVGLITATEPVALLPRGAAAVDTREWIRRAVRLRDGRRRIVALRDDPDEMVVALGDPCLAFAAGLFLRAVARRTPVVLDGPLLLAAALLGQDVRAAAGRWWRAADTSSDPVHQRAVDEFVTRPILDLGMSRADGLAGVLAVAVVRAAATLVPEHDDE